MTHISELHYFYPFEDIVFVSDFPKNISVDKEFKLHNTNGEALSYRDSYNLYAINGEVKSTLIEVILEERAS